MPRETIWFYVLPFVVALLAVQPMVMVVRKLAWRWRIIDIADEQRKLPRPPVPLLGGLAIGVVFLLCLLIFGSNGFLLDGKISVWSLWGVAVGVSILLVGGILDDKFNLRPGQQILWTLAAVVAILAFGIKVTYITNPFGGLIYLDAGTFAWLGHAIQPLAISVSFLWLLGMIYTTKFLDGLDGLVSGITVIGAVVIFIVSLSWDIPYSGTSILSLIVAGLFLGFLFWNFFPAKIFLGESGSTIAGLLLGVLSIISGSKIATALLVMGLPVLDVLWVILRRIFWEKRSPAHGDAKHLHFRLLRAGLTHRQAVLMLYAIATAFGCLALFQNTVGKIVLLAVLLVCMVVCGTIVVYKYRDSQTK